MLSGLGASRPVLAGSRGTIHFLPSPGSPGSCCGKWVDRLFLLEFWLGRGRHGPSGTVF